MPQINPFNSSAAGRAVTSATTALTQIPFVSFTTTLIKEVLQTVTDITLEQLEAYSELVSHVSGTLSQYQDRLLGTNLELQTRADDYIVNVLSLTIGTGASINISSSQYNMLSSQFSNIYVIENNLNKTFADKCPPNSTEIDIDVLRSFVIEKLKGDAELSYNKLIAILKLGMNRVVIDKGEIHTKLTFHVDSNDTDSIDTTDTTGDSTTKSTNWGVRGGFNFNNSLSGGSSKKFANGIIGRSFGGSIAGGISSNNSSFKTKVTVINEKSSAATNINIDIVGSVTINFKCDYFPALNEG